MEETKLSSCCSVSPEENQEGGMRQGGRIPASCPPSFQGRYTVRPGDTMFFIAQRLGVSLQALINANPHITNPSLIFPGDVLCVPGVPPTPDCRVPAACPPGFACRYTVQPGDTMFFIAQRLGVSLRALINANPHIPNPNLIFPCDVLCVPCPTAPQCRVPVSCPPGFQCRYTVQPGDSMFLIAQRLGVSLQALLNANPHITNPNEIFPCDVLCVPCPTAPQCRVPVSCPSGFACRYTVQPGDSMFLIAQRFGVSLQALLNANPHITDPSLIFPCDVLCVPCPKKPLKLPCCLLLTLIEPIPGANALGVAMVQNLTTNRQAVSVIVARVPRPQDLGAFNAHEAVITIPGVSTFRLLLREVQLDATLYAGTMDLPPGVLTEETRIRVRAVNTKTGKFSDFLLAGTLAECC